MEKASLAPKGVKLYFFLAFRVQTENFIATTLILESNFKVLSRKV